MHKAYFPVVKNAPSPLSLIVKRRVRFEEVDFMGIVWHGCYLSYFEDGRVALGHQYGISYTDFIRERIRAPVRQMGIDYHHPLRLEEDFEIKTIMHWSDSARINLEYEIRNVSDKLVCTGYTVQLMLDEHSNVFLTPPPFFSDFLRRWKQGELA
jgi:acyl-CoA thioester hydrolase